MKAKILLLLVPFVVYADDFSLVVEGNDGLPITSCGAHAVISPIQYDDGTCQMQLEMVVDNSTVNIPLGTCAGIHKTKIIIDNMMYKFSVDHQLYNNLFGSEDTLALPVNLGTCTGNTSNPTDLMLYTDTDIIPLDADFGLIWGTDTNGKPVLVAKSSTGILSCANGLPITLVDLSDLIFKSGYE